MNKNDILELLEVTGESQARLFQKARNRRGEHFDSSGLLRGVIEITNACRVDCDYCPMRRSSRIARYVMPPDKILAASALIKETGIRVVFLQGGEIPKTTQTASTAIPNIRKLFEERVEILLCLGDKTPEEYQALKAVGADSYILKFEASSPQLHRTIRHTELKARIDCLESLIELGYRVGSGTIVGLPGQTHDHLAEDILLCAKYQLPMVSASPFIPAEHTPFLKENPGDLNTTLNTIAILRLLLPKALIPSVSALEKLRPGGQLEGLKAGANVLTINFTPTEYRDSYRIYGKKRFIVQKEHASRTLAEAGLSFSRNL